MYAIELTPKNANFRPHIWREGYVGHNEILAEKYAKQMRKIRLPKHKDRLYQKVEVVKLSKLLTDLLTN